MPCFPLQFLNLLFSILLSTLKSQTQNCAIRQTGGWIPLTMWAPAGDQSEAWGRWQAWYSLPKLFCAESVVWKVAELFYGHRSLIQLSCCCRCTCFSQQWSHSPPSSAVVVKVFPQLLLSMCFSVHAESLNFALLSFTCLEQFFSMYLLLPTRDLTDTYSQLKGNADLMNTCIIGTCKKIQKLLW